MRRRLLAIAGSMIFMSWNALTSGAQIIRADGVLPSFEVATIKPPNPKVRVLLTPPGSENPVTQAGTAKTLIAHAYGVRPARVLGGPSWIDDSSKVYVIEGKIPQELFARMQTMTGDQRHNLACLMLQSLLASRFDLKVHIESREMPVYELVLAKGGAKLPSPNGEKPPASSGSRVQQMSGGEAITKNGVRISNMTLDDMLLPPWFDLGDRPIINKTGLTGKYNVTINWLPDIAAQRGPGTEIAAPEGQASIFTALEEQFGLKLVPTHAPVDVVVIDAIQPPSEN
jgi:bla regulator protein blaR1